FYRSTDGGLRWSATTIFNLSSVGAEYFDSLGNALPITVHPISSEVLAITASDYGSRPPWKLWSSSDYGKTFHLRGQFPFRLRKVLFHPKYREVVYGFGLPKYDLGFSSDGGKNFTAFQNLSIQDDDCSRCTLNYYEFSDLCIDPNNPVVMYASA